MQEHGRTHWLRRYDWDAVARVIAAAVALVLHLFHVIETEIILSITLVLVAIILLRNLRQEDRAERVSETTACTARTGACLHCLTTASPRRATARFF